jgi:hypothetical protein
VIAIGMDLTVKKNPMKFTEKVIYMIMGLEFIIRGWGGF